MAAMGACSSSYSARRGAFAVRYDAAVSSALAAAFLADLSSGSLRGQDTCTDRDEVCVIDAVLMWHSGSGYICPKTLDAIDIEPRWLRVIDEPKL